MSASFPSGGGSPTPTVIKEGHTFHVKAETQVLFAESIDIQGELVIDGELVEVS